MNRTGNRWIFRLSRADISVLVIGLIAAVSCGLLWWANNLWERSYSTYAPATASLNQARHAATHAFLVQVKLMAGEPVIAQQVVGLLDNALISAADGARARSTLIGIDAEQLPDRLQAQWHDYQLALLTFVQISRDLLDGKGDRVALHIRQHDAFHEADRMADRIEMLLAQDLASSVSYQRVQHRVALGLWLAFLVAALALLGRAAGVEAAFNRQQSMIRAVMESSTDAIFVKDLEGRYLFFNQGASRSVGVPAEEVLGKTDHLIFSPETADNLMRIDRSVIEGRRVRNHQEELVTAAGETKVFWVTKGPLMGNDDKVFGLFGISRDITEAKTAEDRLRESEETYRSLFTNMLDAFAYCRMIFGEDDYLDFEYELVNAAFTELTGLQDVVGRRVSEVIPGIQEADPGLMQAFARVALGGKPERFEVYVNALGLWFSVALHCPKYGWFVAAFDQISARKQTEAALRQQDEELRQRNQELERFNLAMVGRELEMIEMKRQINALSQELGRHPPYPLAFLEDSPAVARDRGDKA